MGEFRSQLRTLLKKNLLLKGKSKCAICCEILFPIIVILVIFAILVLVMAFKANYDPYDASNFSFRINNESKVLYGNADGALNIEQLGVMNVMKNQVATIRNLTLTQVESFFIEMNNQSMMEEYFSINKDNVFAGIWFNNSALTTSTHSFQYNIRLDSDDIMDTEEPIKEDSTADSEIYLKKHFAATQVAMDQAIFGYFNLNKVLMVKGQRYPDPWTELWQKWIQGRDGIFIDAGSVFITAALMIFGFRLVTDLVIEKETKIRESMKMMGLNDLAYFTSWIITSLTTALPVNLLISIILKGSAVIYHANWGVVIFTLILYLLTLLLLAFILSMFFDKSKFCGLLSFVIIIAINIGGIFVAKYEFDTGAKLFLCLISPIAIACSIYAMSARDLEEINTYNWDKIVTENQVIGMLVLDIFFYAFLVWYLDKVVTTEFGTKQKWYFLFTKKYWFPKKVGFNNNNSEEQDIESTYQNEDVEMTPVGVGQKVTISIRNLRKEYHTGDGLRVAVNDLYLDMYENQIHALLGPNGSGKSTTIGMMTGLTPPTSGNAFVHGYGILNQMSSVRRHLGVCPQTDIIWQQLTVLDHLKIYASLKGVAPSEIQREAEKMANEIDLGEKIHTQAGSLSGGQKRKLCLGIAFIGRSDVIFLDEVSSGMDPLSRRGVWDFLLKYKKGRTIILTTHYLEEADYLGDRIAIISHGKLRCDGSSLYLKNKFGCGYLLTCSKMLSAMNNFNSQQVTEFIHRYIPEATVLSNAGTELSYRLPTASLPEFAQFFRDFDDHLQSFGLLNYGISVTTLEEVFLSLGREAAMEKGGFSIDQNEIQDQENLRKSIAISSTGVKAGQQFKGLLVKRIRTSIKDAKSFFLTLVIPLVFIIGSIIMYKAMDKEQIFYNNSTMPLTMNLDLYSSISPPNFVPMQSSNEIDWSASINSSPYFNIFSFIPQSENFEDYLIKGKFNGSYAYKTSAGAINFTEPIDATSTKIQYTAFYNKDYIHSLPVHVNLVHDALLRKHNNIGIEITNMPFKHVLSNFDLASEGMNISAIVYFIIIMMAGYALMAGSFAGNVAQERTNRVKRLLYISGCKKYVYWLSNLVWDYFFAFILIILTACILAGIRENYKSQFGLMFLCLILFCASIVPLSYLLSYRFASFGKATGAITAIHFAVGIIFVIISLNLRIQVLIDQDLDFQKATDAVDTVFCILSPLFAYSRILFLVSEFPGSTRLGSIKVDNYWSMNYGGTPMIILAAHCIVWVSWIIILDYTPEIIGKLRNPKNIEAPQPPEDEDSDVTAERTRLLSIGPNDEALQFRNLHKLFPAVGKAPPKAAVYNSTLSIPKGQTFGLLGLNGAGKTTTISMLCGDIVPSSGEVTINGHDLITDRGQALRSNGLCPQFDALITLLSAREQLRLYCAIKGVPEDKVDQVVEAFIKMMDLSAIANSNTGGYSGGNKRKTSLSIAMLGNPSIVYLDEPSSGCDATVRKYIWNVVSELGRDKVIVLTSHSMAEVEALAAKMTIMRDGKMKCLGSIQHIKSKFGAGYTFDVKFKKEYLDSGIQTVLKTIPNSIVLDEHDVMASFEIPNPQDNPVKISTLFESLSQLTILDDYNVSQTSLESVFLKLTGASYEDRLNLNNQKHTSD
ncbi:hypothetical protein RB653_007779 [Dictyostelium firmibasis]|uniref:ABC transporter domain-containing protein n=1 Tax=Dictyostelium firmibasis TaxID=79012 RepID=A0AAN7YY45_9MYCE